MNHLLLLVSFLVAAASVQAVLDPSKYTPKLLELSKSLPAKCLPQSGTDEESVQKVIKGEFTDEPKIKAYMKCLLVESGVVTEDKGLNVELAAELIPADILDESLVNANYCLGKIKDIPNEEDKVFGIVKCYYEKNPDLFVFF